MTDLGQPIMVHLPRRRERGLHIAMAAVGLSAGGILMLIGSFRWSFAMSTYGPAVVWRWSGVWLASGGLLTVIGAVGAIWLVRWNWLSVSTYERGLQLRRGRKITIVLWTDIQAILVSGVTYGLLGLIWESRSSLRLDLSGGKRLRFSDTLAGLAQLITTIKSHVYPRLLAEYTQYLRDGQPVAFGPLNIRPEGVTRGQRRLAWSEVVSAELKSGKIVVKTEQRGVPIRASARSVPNAELCLQLIQHYVREARG